MQTQHLIGKIGRRLARPVRLYALWQSRDPYLQLLAASAQGALKNALTPEESAWVARIEGLRAELAASTEQVSRSDYGAGLRHGAEEARSRPSDGQSVRVADAVQRIAKSSSKNAFWSLFLFKLIRSLRPQRCVEMGTALGISGAYQAAALRLNGQGSFVSLEGSPELAAIARRNWDALGLTDARVVVGAFAETLDGVAETEHPDFVFVDGHHEEHATLGYFERLLPRLAPAACLVFDDITWSVGMRRAWRTLSRDSRVKVSVDFGPMGVVLVGDVTRRPPSRAALA